MNIKLESLRVQRQFLKEIIKNEVQSKMLYNKYIKTLSGDVAKYLSDDKYRQQFQKIYGTTLYKDILGVTTKNMETSALLGAEVNMKLIEEAIDGKVATTIAKKAMDGIMTGELYKDNIGLEQRLLYNVANDMKNLDTILFNELKKETSTAELAKALLDNKIYFTKEEALRTARTSINQSFHLSTIESSKSNPAVGGVKWNLSSSHPMEDICDDIANDNADGLGPGIYYPDNVPLSHPNCLCYLTPVLKEDI